MNKVLAMVLAGGTGQRLSILTTERAKPDMPFGGKYRIIDFTLSNCANSGLNNVAILTQYNPRSLTQHIGIGSPWGLDRGPACLTILQPFLSHSGRDWYQGTADAVYQNLYFIEEQRADEVLILSGDHVYTMRYDHLIATHRQRRADVTVGVVEVPPAETKRFGIVTLDHTERIIDFLEKPEKAPNNLASMGIYVFNKDMLLSCLEEDAGSKDSTHDFGRDIIRTIINRYKVYAYRFRGYWRDIGTVESYWQANMDLIVDLPEFNLYDPEMAVHTVSVDMPPVKLGPLAHVTRSLVSTGCIINGWVENSVLSRGVYIDLGVVVKDSIIFSDTTILKDAYVHRCIIDKEVEVGAGSQIGAGEESVANVDEPDNLNCGITLVGKGAVIPPGTKIGHNCRINCSVVEKDFSSNLIPAGQSVNRKTARRHRM